MMKKWHITPAVLLLVTLIYFAFWTNANSNRAFHENEGFGALAWLAFFEVVPLLILGIVLVVVLVAHFFAGKYVLSALWWSFAATIFYLPVLMYGWGYILSIRKELEQKQRDKKFTE